MKKVFDFLSGSFLGKANDLIDNLVTNKEEKAILNIEMQKLIQEGSNKVMEFVTEENKEITKRHEADMNSDSKLSKNIRPGTLMFLLGAYVFFAVTDGNFDLGIDINESYVLMLGEWTKSVMFFYFGGRTIEKVAPKAIELFKKK